MVLTNCVLVCKSFNNSNQQFNNFYLEQLALTAPPTPSTIQCTMLVMLVIEHFAAFNIPIKITAIITALGNTLALLPSICRRSNMSQINTAASPAPSPHSFHILISEFLKLSEASILSSFIFSLHNEKSRAYPYEISSKFFIMHWYS